MIVNKRSQPGVLTNESASGACIETDNHSDIWLALIHKQPVTLRVSGRPDFDARVQKVTQLRDGRLAVGLSYERNTIAIERSAVALAFGSSTQLQHNLLLRQHRKNVLTMSLMLLHKALILGFSHFVLLTKAYRRVDHIEEPTPRLIWDRKNENVSIFALDRTNADAHDRLAFTEARVR